MNQDLQRFRELLPFFVNGSLDTEEQDFINTYLEQHPEVQEELEFEQSLRSAVKSIELEHDSAKSLQRLHKAIHEQQHPEKKKNEYLWSQFWINWGLTPAMTAISAVVIVQALLIIELWDDKTIMHLRSEYQWIGRSTQTSSLILKVSINTNANFSELAELFRQTGCRIVAGPSEENELWLKLDDSSRFAEIRTSLETSPNITALIISSE